METVTKSGEVISTETSYKDKEKELQRTVSSKTANQFSMNEDGVIDLTSGGGLFYMDSKRASANNADVLGGMSELKGELRRETERMNAKMGVVEAQMRLVLKLLRRNNKINDIDPEIGMQLDELMHYDNPQHPHLDDVDDDTEWFVADAKGWKDGPSRGTTSSSRASNNKPAVSTSSHSRVVEVASKLKPAATTPSKQTPVESMKKASIADQKTVNAKKLSTANSNNTRAKSNDAVIDIPNKSLSTASKTSTTTKPPANKVSTTSQKPSVPSKNESTSSQQAVAGKKPAPKARDDPKAKGKHNNTFEDEDFETIVL